MKPHHSEETRKARALALDSGCPELALPLAPYLRRAPDLPPLAALQAVEFLHRAAHPELINANLTERALHAIPEVLNGYGWTQALVALANSEPVALLRLLRARQ